MRSKRLVGRVCWELFPEGTRTQGYRKLHEAMDQNRSVHYLEYSLRYGIWYEVTAYPQPHGDPLGGRPLDDALAAVHHQDGAGHVARRVGGQVRHRAAQLVGTTLAAHRDLREHRRQLLLG